jgi:hypothetical protein
MPRRVSFICGVVLTACLEGCDNSPTAPSDLFELALSPSTVAAGTAAQGTVTLRGRTRSAVQITLSTSDAVASVPSTVVVPSGTLSTPFTVTTRVVAADTVARIAATAGTTTREIALQVVAPVAGPATLDALQLDAAIVRGGQTVQGTVRLTGAAPAGGLSVSVRGSNSAAVAPATVIVPAGALTSTFAISTRPVSVDTQLEITAVYADQTRTVLLRVTT